MFKSKKKVKLVLPTVNVAAMFDWDAIDELIEDMIHQEESKQVSRNPGSHESEE